MPRYFTVEEAHAALATIRPLVEQIADIREEILKNKPQAWPVIEKAAGNGGSRAASQMAQSFERLDKLVHQILDMGVLVKDINTGLLDFPALRNGQEVYLCWQLGEDQIEFWHEIDDGFSGRQPLDTF